MRSAYDAASRNWSAWSISVGDQTASRDKPGKGINCRNVKSRRLGQDALPVRNGQNVRITITAPPCSATAANALSISAGSLTGLTVSSTPKTVAAAFIDCKYTPPLAPALGCRIKQHRDLFAIRLKLSFATQSAREQKLPKIADLAQDVFAN
jgi:hypothetical protein